METQTTQFFFLGKTKKPKKVYDIEAEYEDMSDAQLFIKCTRCKKVKHVHQFGSHYSTGKPLKSCEPCREYNKYYNALRNYGG